MRIRDFLTFSSSTLKAYPGRSLLTSLGIAIGIASVVLLTSIGEGIHQFVLAEFTQFGSNLIGINPGRVTTAGTPLGVLGNVRPLTLEDAESLKAISQVEAVVPIMQGNAEVEANGRQRRTTIYGVGPELPRVFRGTVQSGRFLPEDDPRAPRAYAVLGSKLKTELFGTVNPLGQRIRIAGERYVILGVMAPKGQFLGIDLDDTVFIPANRALEMFNRNSLVEIDVMYSGEGNVDEIVAAMKRVLIAKHGQEDFTITTQQQMMKVLGSVLNVLTFAVAAIGGISLLVGGVGILTIMTIAYNERISEIGLLRALGSTRQQVLSIFLAEAVFLAALGGVAGLILGVGCALLLKLLIPLLPVYISWGYALLAEFVAAVIGLSAGVMPALRAMHVDPISAIRRE